MFAILIGMHGFLILKVLPLINNINGITIRINTDYHQIYPELLSVLNKTSVLLTESFELINNLNNSTDVLVSNTLNTLNNITESINNLNSVIINLNNTLDQPHVLLGP